MWECLDELMAVEEGVLMGLLGGVGLVYQRFNTRGRVILSAVS